MPTSVPFPSDMSPPPQRSGISRRLSAIRDEAELDAAVSREAGSMTMPRRMSINDRTLSVERTAVQRSSMPPAFMPVNAPYQQQQPQQQPSMSRSFPNPHDEVTRMLRQGPRNRNSLQSATVEIPPTPPLQGAAAGAFGAPRPARALPVPTPRTMQQHPNLRHPLDETNAASDASGSTWSSGESTPTPTASSIAAARSRSAQDESQLIPIQLVPPPQQPQIAHAQSMPNVAPLRAQRPQQQQQQPVGPTQASSSVPQPQRQSQPLPQPRQQQAQPSTSITPASRKDISNLRPFRLSDGQLPVQARDYIKAMPTSVPMERSESSGPGPHSQATRSSNTAQTEQLRRRPSVGGHALDTSTVGVIVQRDGRAREIYSPTPEKVMAARRDQSPLPPTALPPSAPRPEQTLRFRRSMPTIGTPEASRPGSSHQPPTDRNQQRTAGPSRNTFGSDANLFAEADRKLRAEAEKRAQAEAAEAEAAARERERRVSMASSMRRESFSSEKTALDTPQFERVEWTDAPTLRGSRAAEKRRMSDDIDPDYRRPKGGQATGLFAPPSAVPESREVSSVGRRQPTTGGQEESELSKLEPFIVNTNDDEPSHAGLRRKRSFMRFIPIVNTQRRPGTGQSRVSFRSDTKPPRAHVDPTACRACFRAGFECATNLHMGQNTAGRKAFQEFVAAGGLQALSVHEGSERGAGGRSVALGDALGENFVDRLTEVKFGESALSRPVTRGAIEDMLQDREMRNLLPHELKNKLLDAENEKAAAAKAEAIERAYADERDYPMEEEQRRSEEDPIHSIVATEASTQPDTIEDEELFYLADRWPFVRKCYTLAVFLIWVVSMQALDSGLVSSLPRIAVSVGGPPTALVTLRLSFLWGELGGLMTAGSLADFPRQRVAMASLAIASVFSVIAGFARDNTLLTIMRGSIGFSAGLFLGQTIGVIADVFCSMRSRAAALTCLLCTIVAGQISGPYIALLIVNLTTWSWLYWITPIVAVAEIALIGTTTRETSATWLFHKEITALREAGAPWTPEPRKIPLVRNVVRYLLPLPWKVMFLHPAVILTGIPSLFVGAAMTIVVDGFSQALVTRHRFSVDLASLTIATCGIISILFAPLFIWLGKTAATSNPTAPPSPPPTGIVDQAGDEKTVQQRSLSTSHDVATMLFFASVAGSAISLYTLALTMETLNWIFSALSLILLFTSVIVAAVTAIDILLQAYHPAGRTGIPEVVESDEDHEHFSRDSDQESSGRVPRPSVRWALCAIGAWAAYVLFGTGIMTFIGPAAFLALPFSTVTIILASAVLAITPVPYILHRFFARLHDPAVRRVRRFESNFTSVRARQPGPRSIGSYTVRSENVSDRRTSQSRGTSQQQQQRSATRSHSQTSRPASVEGAGGRRPLLLASIMGMRRNSSARKSAPTARPLEISEPFDAIGIPERLTNTAVPLRSYNAYDQQQPAAFDAGEPPLKPRQHQQQQQYHQQRSQDKALAPRPSNPQPYLQPNATIYGASLRPLTPVQTRSGTTAPVSMRQEAQAAPWGGNGTTRTRQRQEAAGGLRLKGYA